MSTSQGLHGAGEGAGGVVVPVVHDDAVEFGDAGCGEAEACPGEESDRGRSSLITECFGVGQPGVHVDSRVQVGVSDSPLRDCRTNR